MNSLWQKNGSPPVALPVEDRDAAGRVWRDLAESAEGRAACGWTPAPTAPDFDPVERVAVWDIASSAWSLVALTAGPSPVELARQAIEAERDRRLAGGYAHDFGAAVGIKRLQTRGVDDKINWLTSQAAYGAAVASGAGDVLGAEFRGADNATFVVSFRAGLAALLDMAAWGSEIMSHSWALKDALAAGADPASLDLASGWPSDPVPAPEPEPAPEPANSPVEADEAPAGPEAAPEHSTPSSGNPEAASGTPAPADEAAPAV